jgi:hypothetical protein
MHCSLYIYYRVNGNFLPFRQASARLMADVHEKLHINGRLLQRRDDAQTWMEIYEPVSDAAALQQLLAEGVAGDPCWQGVSRHEEWFVPLADTVCQPAEPHCDAP